MTLLQRISRMFFESAQMDTTALEFSISLQCVFFGSWLLLPLETFTASTAFAVMASLAREEAWGMAFLTVGLLDMWMLHLKNMRIRKFVVATILALWMVVDISVFVSGSASTAGAIFMVTVFSTAWCIVSMSIRSKAEICGY